METILTALRWPPHAATNEAGRTCVIEPGNVMSLKSTWDGYSTKKKWLIGGGGALLLLIVAASQQPHPGPAPGPSPGPNGGGGYQQGGQAYQGGGDQQQGGPAYQGGGGAPYVAPQGGYAAGAVPPAPDYSNNDQYWATQRSNEQRARAYDETIRETNTVRDNDTGTVYTDVPNQVADPAIQTGNYSEVPTNELPTTTPAPAPAADSPPPQE
jgi:hypothetical protein